MSIIDPVTRQSCSKCREKLKKEKKKETKPRIKQRQSKERGKPTAVAVGKREEEKKYF